MSLNLLLPARVVAWAAGAAIALAACGHAAVAPPAVAACPADAFAIAGACLSLEEATAYCGKTARPEAGGCAPVSCPPDEPIDMATGACVPLLSLRQLSAGPHAKPKLDGGLGCTDAGLVVEGRSIACLPHSLMCGRGARWSLGACHPDPACPPGAVADGTGACIGVVHRDRGESVVDVGTWIRLVMGPDGGEGSSVVCGPLDARPWRMGVVSHGTGVIDVQLDIVFPDNEVKAARVAVTAHRHIEPNDPSPVQWVPVTHFLEPVSTALRSLGGLANAASATVHLHCTVEGGSDVLGAPPAEKEEAPAVHPAKPPAP